MKDAIHRTLCCVVLLVSCLISTSPGQNLQTVAEQSEFTKTATYDQVVDLIHQLDQASDTINTTQIGSTSSGRAIPMLIIADPPIATPEQARNSGKLVVLMIGNIHAGEVCGKEALLMLAREIGTTPDQPLLKDFVLCIVPLYNADGNEHMAAGNRPGQLGPAQMGKRTNDMGLDLNRDFIKTQAPETHALLRVFRRWNPDIFIDTHTTNGSHHRYVLTYSGPKNPGGNKEILSYIRDTMLPRITQNLRETKGIETFTYGNFAKDHTQWTTFPASPRYSTNYAGMRNRLAFLSEAYSYATYKERITATHDFCLAIIEDTQAHKDEIRELFSHADDQASTGSTETNPWPVRTKPVALPETAAAKGFVENEQDGKHITTDEPKEYEVQVIDNFVGQVEIQKPWAYLLPAKRADIVPLLKQHGIVVDILREDIELDAENFEVVNIAQAENPFQGHRMETLVTQTQPTVHDAVAGDYLVRVDQKLGNLVVAMLEPQAEDSLATWNFFDVDGQAPAIGDTLSYVQLRESVPLLTTPTPPLAEDRNPPEKITYELLYDSKNRPNLNGSPMRSIRWLDDTQYAQVRDGKTWRIDAKTGRILEQITGENDTSLFDVLVALPSIDEAAAKRIDHDRRFLARSNGQALFLYENDLYVVSLDGTTARRLTATPEAEELPTLSPNSIYAAFVRGNNLYAVEISTGIERQLTTTGTDKIRNGKNPWIYYEEIFGRNWRSYWWSPNSKYIVYYETDSTDVDTFTITDDAVEPQKIIRTEYPKPGSPNPDIRLGVVSAAGGAPTFVNLSEYTQGGYIVSSMGWWPDSSRVYFSIQDRAQHWLDFSTALPSGGTPTRLLRQHTQAWVEAPSYFRFLSDNSFLITSEETGFKHLYHYASDGSLIKQITSGPWEVRSVAQYNNKTSTLYFNTTADSPLGSSLYAIDLDGSNLRNLTPSAGIHRVSMSPDSSFIIDTWSTVHTPTRSVLRDNAGNAIRILDTNPVFAQDEYALGKVELVSIPTSRSTDNDTINLEGLLVYPPDFDANKKYPVWFMTYAGPHAPTVYNSWQGGRTSDHMLASSGFIVFRADPYSASGKGAKSAWTAYRKLGQTEMEDINDIINWIKAKPFVDPDRIGMSGYSYGGFMTAYAMTHSDHFAAGIAGGTVTSWRDYDTIYTERYMDTPQENPDGYDATSVVKAAKNLHGNLLLVHGWVDDNVHTQNSVKLIKALQDANKDFEMAFYPRFAHGIWSAHYRKQTYDFQMRLIRKAPY